MATKKQRYVKDEAGFVYPEAVFKDADGKLLTGAVMRASKEDIKDFLLATTGRTEAEVDEVIENHVEA